jgi:nitroreductase
MNSIFTRRSIRKYLNKPVESEKVEQLLKAAMQAPSAGNQQPWEFIVVQDKELLRKLSLTSPYAGPVKEALVAIVVLGNKENIKFPEYLQQDLSAATQNLLLQAVELELGAVWLGVAPLEERMKYITELFDLPESILPFAVVPVGYPEIENKYIDRYEKAKIHYGKY